MPTRLLAVLVGLAALTTMACASSTPAPPATALPADTPAPTPSPLPTVTPYPTYTAAPTPTPYPTPTSYPTPTPYPTPTERPAPTPYPTPTPLPTVTPYPTYTPVPTATPPPTPTPRPTTTPRPPPTPLPTATPRPTATPQPTSTPHPTATPRPPAIDYSFIVDRVRPALVRFVTSSNDGFGSGFIFDTEGETAYVLTNAHVVAGRYDGLRVNVGDEQLQYRAVVLGATEDVDLAVVWICCSEDFQALPLAESPVGVGTEVGAFGYPHSATKMLASWANVEKFYDEPQVVSEEGKASGWDVRLTSTLAPGSSGGPIVNGYGEVVAVAVGAVSNTPSSVATSVARVEGYTDQLYGSHVRGVSRFPQAAVDWRNGPTINDRGFLRLDVVIDTKLEFDPCGHNDSSCIGNVHIWGSGGVGRMGRIFPWEVDTNDKNLWVATRHNYYPAQGRFIVESSTAANLHTLATNDPGSIEVCIFDDDGTLLNCAPLQAQ